MPILRTVVEGKKLTMDTRGPQVQIVLTGKDAARLSFPTEDNAEAFFEIHKTPGS
jgi:hypothetical protein